jgi:hypothetical protein
MPAETSLDRYLAILVLLAGTIANLAIGAEPDATRVQQSMSSGQISWMSAFDVEITRDEVVVSIGISLMVPGVVNRPLLENRMLDWKDAIDAIWNNRFLVLVEQARIPVRFDIRFTHFKPHHRVVIHPGDWVANQHNWYIDTPALIVAHEIGHMLGAYDEYNGGALSPRQPMIDESSIMGAVPASGIAYPRHLALLRRELVDEFDDSQIRLVVD